MRTFGPMLRRGAVTGAMQRRALFTRAVAAVLAAAPLFARGTPAAAGTQLRIGGTGMALAAIRKIGTVFTAANQDVAVNVLPSLGTGGGLNAVAAGAIELALSARALNEAERAKGLRAMPYARTPIAFAAHPDAGIREITLMHVMQIFRGQLLSWPNGKAIRLIRREPSDADWGMLRAISPDMTDAIRIALERPGLLTVATDQENADSIERLSGAFGAMSLGQIRAESRYVVPLTLDGEPPTTEDLAAGHYKLSRTLYVVWRDQPGVDATAFVAFLATPQAKDILAQLGHIPLAGVA
jgi:phosphate transport system substrate-binding protein